MCRNGTRCSVEATSICLKVIHWSLWRSCFSRAPAAPWLFLRPGFGEGGGRCGRALSLLCLGPQPVRLCSDVLLASGVAPFFKQFLCLNVRDRVPVSNDLFVSLKTPGSPRANALRASTAWWCGFEGLLPLWCCGSVESGCPCSAVSALGKGAAPSALPDPVRYGPESCSQEEETASSGQPSSVARLPKTSFESFGQRCLRDGGSAG